MNISGTTLDDIAKAAGVTKMTVSRALRNHTSISGETKKRIQRIAKQLGYRPNPLLSIFQAHVRSRKAPGYQATLGWINDHDDPAYWRKTSYTSGLLEGAKNRAKSLGYNLDEIWIEQIDPVNIESNIRRYSRVLRSRGIHGIILPLANHPGHAFSFWPDVALTQIGLAHGLALHNNPSELATGEIDYHKASFDYFTNARLACEKLRRQGYRRIGLLISRWLDAHTDKLYRGCFLAEQLDWPKEERIPIIFDDSYTHEPPQNLDKWLNKHQPDVLLCAKSEVREWLSRLGWRVPKDIGLAHLYLAQDVKDWSGIDPRLVNVGAAAVDLVVQQLRLNERGVPSIPQELFCVGQWVDGKTTKLMKA